MKQQRSKLAATDRRPAVERLEQRRLLAVVTSIGIGNTIGPITPGDFNNDGKTDLLAVINDGDAVMLSNGDGTFRTAGSIPIGASPVVGDFNKDGKLDVASFIPATATAPSAVQIVLGHGDGTFDPPAVFSTGIALGSMDVPMAMTAGDFKGDGKLDVALVVALPAPFGSQPVIPIVLPGRGDGTFGAAIDTSLSATLSQGDAGFSVAAADFNGDGKLDLVLPQGVELGNGDGTFRAAPPLPVTPFSSAIVTGDVNNDGKTDLVTLSSRHSLITLFGNGDGTFRVGPALDFGDPEETSAVSDLRLADFNGDGKLDLATTYTPRSSILLGLGDGSFSSAQDLQFGDPKFSQIAVADFNGDGVPDVALTDQLNSELGITLSPTPNGVLQFGTVGGRHASRAVQRLPGGLKIAYALSGPGTARVIPGVLPNTYELDVLDTDATSRLHIAANHPTSTLLDLITVSGSIGSIDARSAVPMRIAVGGNVQEILLGKMANGPLANGANDTLVFSGNVRRLSIASPNGGISIGGTTPASLVVAGALYNLTSSAPLQLVRASLIDGHITAPSIVNLICARDSDSALSLTGAPAGQDTLGAVHIGGDLHSSVDQWFVNGNIGLMDIRGSLENFELDAGAMEQSDPSAHAATIHSIRIGGEVGFSIIAAGLSGKFSITLAPSVKTISGGAIGRIEIGGFMDNYSRILAASLPARSRIAGRWVNTADDARFQI